MIEVVLIVDPSSEGSFDVAKLVAIYCHNSNIQCHLVCQTEALSKARGIEKSLSSIPHVCTLNLATPRTLLGTIRAICSSIRGPTDDDPKGKIAAVVNLVERERINCRPVESWDCDYIEYEVVKLQNLCMMDILQWIGLLVKAKVSSIKSIGVIMSVKRIRKLSAKEFLPLIPLAPELNIHFIPLNPDNASNTALSSLDGLLIKYSDFVSRVDWAHSVELVEDLQGLLDRNDETHRVPYVDSLRTVGPVMDRKAMYQLLDIISSDARKKAALPVRAAAWDLVDSQTKKMDEKLIPCLIKPRIACGVSEAHQMGLILKGEGLGDCGIPLPWVIQEYVNHGGMIWKVYVANDAVMFEKRISMPNIDGNDADDSLPSCIEFDSLKSLPTRLPWLEGTQGTPGRQSVSILTESFFRQLASIVKSHAHLSVFGFDVVFDYEAGEAVIVDLNYLPSFGDIENASTDFIKAFM